MHNQEKSKIKLLIYIGILLLSDGSPSPQIHRSPNSKDTQNTPCPTHRHPSSTSDNTRLTDEVEIGLLETTNKNQAHSSQSVINGANTVALDDQASKTPSKPFTKFSEGDESAAKSKVVYVSESSDPQPRSNEQGEQRSKPLKKRSSVVRLVKQDYSVFSSKNEHAFSTSSHGNFDSSTSNLLDDPNLMETAVWFLKPLLKWPSKWLYTTVVFDLLLSNFSVALHTNSNFPKVFICISFYRILYTGIYSLLHLLFCELLAVKWSNSQTCALLFSFCLQMNFLHHRSPLNRYQIQLFSLLSIQSQLALNLILLIS